MSYNFSKEEINKALEAAKSITGAARLMGVSYNAFARLAKKYNCFITNQGGKGMVKKSPRSVTREILDLVFQNKHYYTAYKLKGHLFNFGLKEKRCECCGLSEWMGKEIPLELHHKNGNHHDNTWDNLQILCPNCHGQTEHYRGANKVSYKDKKAKVIELTEEEQNILYVTKEKAVNVKKEPKPKKPRGTVKTCKVCGKEFISKNRTFCSIACSEEYKRKNIPSKEEIIAAIPLYKSARTLCTHWGVTDNALKRWLKQYDINIYDYGYRKLGNKANTYK